MTIKISLGFFLLELVQLCSLVNQATYVLLVLPHVPKVINHNHTMLQKFHSYLLFGLVMVFITPNVMYHGFSIFTHRHGKWDNKRLVIVFIKSNMMYHGFSWMLTHNYEKWDNKGLVVVFITPNMMCTMVFHEYSPTNMKNGSIKNKTLF